MYQYNPAMLVQVDIQELTKALSHIFKLLDSHETKISDLMDSQNETELTVAKHDKKIAEFEAKSIIFEESIKEVNIISDKVNSWSERFRDIEERNFGLSRSINELSTQIQSQIDELKYLMIQAAKSAQNDTKRDLIHRIEESESQTSVKTQILFQNLERQVADQNITIENSNKENLQRIEELNNILGLANQNLHEKEMPKTPRDPGNARNFTSRLNSLEKTLQNYISSNSTVKAHNTQGQMDSQAVENSRPRDESVFDSKKFSIVIDNVDQKPNFRELEVNPIHDSLESGRNSISYDNYLPMSERIITVKNKAHENLQMDAFENKLEKLNEKIEYLYEKSMSDINLSKTEINISKSEISIEPIKRESKEVFIPPLNPPKTKAAKHNTVMDKKFSKLENEIENLQSTILELKFHSEDSKIKEILDEKFSSFAKNARETLIKQISSTSEEVMTKVVEIETRINHFWKESQIVKESLTENSTRLEKLEQGLREDHRSLVEDIRENFYKFDEKFEKKISEVKESQPKLEPIIEKEQESEIMLRSIVYNLRNEILKIKTIIDNIEQKRQIEDSIFGDSSESTSVDPLGPREDTSLKGILRLHDNAIRNLALKILPNTQVQTQQNADIGNALQYLEDLKAEMKEVLTKQESAKSFTSKDFELINEIYQNLENKSNKSELVQKVDRNELRRIYQMLKKRIDELSENLKKTELNTVNSYLQEEPFFTKKKLDMGCASCGHALSAAIDSNLTQTSWNKQHNRNSTFTPGFSKLLSSLVHTPSGNFALPYRNDEPGSIESVKSPKSASTKNFKQGNLKRIKLPSVKG